MTAAALPSAYQAQLSLLAAGEWRDRKEAVQKLRSLVDTDRDDGQRLHALAERLLDGLLSKDALQGRAAAHEVLVAIGAHAIPAVMARLESDVPSRRLLVDLLGELGDESHVETLARIATGAAEDVNLRAAAVTALGRIGGEGAADVLMQVLRDHAKAEGADEMLASHVLEALLSAGVDVSVRDLEPMLATPFTRKAAAGLMGNSTAPEAASVLAELLGDSIPAVRAEAGKSLVRLDARFRDEGQPDVVTDALRRTDVALADALHELIGRSDRSLRVVAIRLAAAAGEASIVSRVLEVMDDPVLQEEALAMVARIGAPAARVLEEAHRADVIGRREHLVRLIGALPPASLQEDLRAVLVQGLTDADEDAAVAAAEALERAGGERSLADLYRAMAEPGRLGEAAADALGAVVRRSAAYAALDEVVGPSWPQDGELAKNLCRVVGLVGSQRYASHLVSLLGSTDVDVRVAAAQALGNLPGEHEGTSALSFALTDEEAQVRASACRSLGQLGTPQSVQPLLSATHDASPLVRAAAVQALVAIDNPVALSRLRAVIAEDPVPAVVVQAIAGLGRSHLDQDLTMLMSLCTSRDWEVVKAAARALEHFPQHRATAALLGLIGHDRWDVRWAAAEVLSKRGDRTALPSLRQARQAEEDDLVGQVLDEAIAELEHAE